jgi:hypothetical protein
LVPFRWTFSGSDPLAWRINANWNYPGASPVRAEARAVSDKPINNTVQLGCGTLILIAIIVMVFSGGSDAKKQRRQLEDMNRKIDRIEKKIDEVAQGLKRQPAGEAALPGEH